jgi:hypothetical protein
VTRKAHYRVVDLPQSDECFVMVEVALLLRSEIDQVQLLGFVSHVLGVHKQGHKKCAADNESHFHSY